MFKKVWINGCFDVLHRGHIDLFKYAKSFGSVIVGIDGDSRVEELKGPNRPINKEEDRKFVLESVKYIDKVLVFYDENSLIQLIKLEAPDIIIVGSDYFGKRVIGAEFAGELKFFDRQAGYSSTSIINRLVTKDLL